MIHAAKFLTSRAFVLATLLATSSAPVWAGQLSSIKITPQAPVAGQPISAVVDGDDMGDTRCGLRVEWGTGEFALRKIDTNTPLPQTFSFTYNKPGTYSIVVKGDKVESALGCVGKVNADIEVKSGIVHKPVAPQVPKTPMPAAAKLAPVCPSGWKLNAKSVSKKTGAFACGAPTGTPRPEQKLECGPNLYYYEKKATIGCKPG